MCIIINFYYAHTRLYGRNNAITGQLCQLSLRQEGVCGALLDLGQRFSSGASHFDTQGEAIN